MTSRRSDADLPDYRRCRNCGERLAWGRWCVDCVRMAGKTLAVVAVEELLRWALRLR
ncbi:MAG: hypothetical protein ACRD3G_12240 [Vicinamibacterales bacterium]